MSGCSLCGGVKEGFHGNTGDGNPVLGAGKVSLTQRTRMFADKNKGSICICTIALIIGLFFILRKK